MSNQGYCANEIMFCFEICSCRERLSHFVLASVTGRRRLGFICNAQNSCTACSQPRFPAPKELDAKVMGNFSLYPPSLPQAKPLQTSLTSRLHTELPQAFLGASPELFGSITFPLGSGLGKQLMAPNIAFRICKNAYSMYPVTLIYHTVGIACSKSCLCCSTSLPNGRLMVF